MKFIQVAFTSFKVHLGTAGQLVTKNVRGVVSFPLRLPVPDKHASAPLLFSIMFSSFLKKQCNVLRCKEPYLFSTSHFRNKAKFLRLAIKL